MSKINPITGMSMPDSKKVVTVVDAGVRTINGHKDNVTLKSKDIEHSKGVTTEKALQDLLDSKDALNRACVALRDEVEGLSQALHSKDAKVDTSVQERNSKSISEASKKANQTNFRLEKTEKEISGLIETKSNLDKLAKLFHESLKENKTSHALASSDLNHHQLFSIEQINRLKDSVEKNIKKLQEDAGKSKSCCADKHKLFESDIKSLKRSVDSLRSLMKPYDDFELKEQLKNLQSGQEELNASMVKTQEALQNTLDEAQKKIQEDCNTVKEQKQTIEDLQKLVRRK